jgi:hypothetical protein
MHEVEATADRLTGVCKSCADVGTPEVCPMLGWARMVLAGGDAALGRVGVR